MGTRRPLIVQVRNGRGEGSKGMLKEYCVGQAR